MTFRTGSFIWAICTRQCLAWRKISAKRSGTKAVVSSERRAQLALARIYSQGDGVDAAPGEASRLYSSLAVCDHVYDDAPLFMLPSAHINHVGVRQLGVVDEWKSSYRERTSDPLGPESCAATARDSAPRAVVRTSLHARWPPSRHEPVDPKRRTEGAAAGAPARERRSSTELWRDNIK
jgi:hypothetical protein